MPIRRRSTRIAPTASTTMRRQRRIVHVSGVDGGRHPAIQRRQRAGRARPGAASEMARDFGQRFNHLYGEAAGEAYFILPERRSRTAWRRCPASMAAKCRRATTTPSRCSRRASSCAADQSIVTDSRAPGEPKDAEGSHVFSLYQAFASAQETAAMRQAFADGIGWGDAKQTLFERIDTEVAPLRERYLSLIADPARIEQQLRSGAQRLRARYATRCWKNCATRSACATCRRRATPSGRESQGRAGAIQAIPRRRRSLLLQARRRRRQAGPAERRPRVGA